MRSNLASLVEEFRRHGAETAVVAHRATRRYPTTYGELAVLAGRFAAELERRGVRPGERVVLWGENSAEWVGVFFGCLLRGVIAVPLDAAGTVEFAERVVRDVAPRLIVGGRERLGLLAADAGDATRMALAGIAAELPLEPLFEVSAAVGEETPFQIIFTSGTTSEPKGVVHTHRNVLASLGPIESEIAKYRRYERWVHPLRFLDSVPLSHVFGQFMGLWIPALLAAEVHFVEQLEAARLTEVIQREKINVLVAVPRVIELLRVYLLRRFAGLGEELEAAKDLKVWARWWRFRRVHRALGWRFWAVISGGASLSAELEGFWNRVGWALIQGYGLTETAALVTLNHPFKIGRGTIGKALPGREVKLSEEGEILVRGAMLAEATWQDGRMRARESEWLATGDLAAQEASGELRFLGRKSDVIVTGAGMNVHPEDLEAAMAKQPGVRGCVVVPCGAASGVEPVAVMLFAGSEAELEAATAGANRGLAEYQRIRRVLRWPEMQFPHTSTGKLLRRTVREWACAVLEARRQGGGLPDKSGEGLDGELLRMIEQVTGQRATSAAGNEAALRLSEDLYLDSLGRVQLQTALEQRLGVELEDDVLASVGTLEELRAIVEKAAGLRLAPGPADALGPEASAEAVQRAAVGKVPQTAGGADESAARPVYPRWPWSWPVRWARVAFLEAVMRPLVWLLAGPKVRRGRGALPGGPLLVIANHVTAYDGALVLYALPGRVRRRMVIAMSGEMLEDFRRGRNQGNVVLNALAPAAYWLMTGLFNVYPLPRLHGFRRSFAHAGEAMDRGYGVLIFPEGTRSRSGAMQPFRPGIGLLAAELCVPVVPVALIGLGELREEPGRWFRSGRLEVRMGDAIPVDDALEPAARTEMYEAGLRRLKG